MNNGYFGKILIVDLSKENFEEEIIPDETYRQYLGGYGLASKLIYERMEPNSNPLGPDAIFGFFPGLLTGTAAPFSGRYMVCGKSPLTGTWGDANSGGTFGPEIKKCGYDAILIKGAANKPKYIAIIDGKKEILDASEIWGQDVLESELKLKDKHGRFIKTAGIGQSGEKLSLISGIVNDKGRIAARSGFGAVMGSKYLKMLVLKGNQKISYYNKTRFIEFVKKYNKKGKLKPPGMILKSILKIVPKMGGILHKTGLSMETAPISLTRKIFHNLGTSSVNMIGIQNGDSPVKNWGGIAKYDFPSERANNISSIKLNEYKVKNYGCFSCPVQCGAILKIPELDIEETHIPEYETCCAFGTLLLNDDLMSLLVINEMCNRAAIDTISTGGTVAFAIECYENDILSKELTDGLELTWGNTEAIIELVRKIIEREGIGNILADGSKIAAERIGKGSEKFLITSLGQELPMHDPKLQPSLAMSYAFDPTPGKHTTASFDYGDYSHITTFLKDLKLPKTKKRNNVSKHKTQKIVTSINQVINGAGLCLFSLRFGEYPLLELINSLVGWDLSIDDILKIGERIQNLRQVFTLREDVEIAKNELHGRVVGNPPFLKGPHKNVDIDYKTFYKGFCVQMGWETNGYPLKETLKELDLEFVIKNFYKKRKEDDIKQFNIV